MPSAEAQYVAARIEKDLQEALGHEQAKVKPYGAHYLIQLDLDGERLTVARLTPLGSHRWVAAFKPDKRPWEPLPCEGTQEEVIQDLVSMLNPYLMPENY